MRRILLTLFLIASCSLVKISAQSFADFMYQRGGKIVADLAHPTNSYTGCSYDFSSGGLIVTVRYKKGYQTKVFFYFKDNIFYQMSVLSDSDFFPPFLASEGMKNMLYDAVESEAPNMIKRIESEIGRDFRYMDGKQLCCLLFSLSWAAYMKQNNM